MGDGVVAAVREHYSMSSSALKITAKENGDWEDVDVTLNGILSVGLGSHSDVVFDPVSCLTVYEKHAHTVISANRVCAAKKLKDKEAIAAVLSAALILQETHLFDETSNVRISEVSAKPSDVKADEKDLLKFVTPSALAAAADLIFATKVNFFQTNHHTGAGKPTAYFRKVIAADLPNTDIEQAVTAGWIIGHWASTLKVFAQAGLPGVGIPDEQFFVVNWDIKCRLAGFPAGCARIAFFAACLPRIHASLYKPIMPFSTDVTKYVELVQAIKSDPLAYHIGASFLAKGRKGEIAHIDDDTIACCSAFVHALLPTSSLANSKAIFSAEEVSSHPWTLNLNLYRRAVAEAMKVDPALIDKMAKSTVADANDEAALKKAVTLLGKVMSIDNFNLAPATIFKPRGDKKESMDDKEDKGGSSKGDKTPARKGSHESAHQGTGADHKPEEDPKNEPAKDSEVV